MLRSIPLKVFPAVHDKSPELQTLDILQSTLEAPRPGGIDVATMRQTAKLLDAIEVVRACGSNVLKLDEILWQFLKDRIETNVWAFYHRAFLEVTDDVITAASVDPNAT